MSAIKLLGASGEVLADTFPYKVTKTWVSIREFDNTNNAGYYKEKMSYAEKRHSITHQIRDTFVRSLKEKSTSVSAGVNISVSFVGASTDVTDTSSSSDLEEIRQLMDTTEDVETSYSHEWEFEVGPNSTFALYQPVLIGENNSIRIELKDGLTTTKYPDEHFTVQCKITPDKRLIKNLWAENHGQDPSSRPQSVVNEIVGDGQSDVNHGCGGDFVYIVAEYTYDPDEALTGVQLIFQDGPNSSLVDLGAGTGGKYRYLLTLHDKENPNKMLADGLALYRANHETTSFGEGTNYHSTDINQGRGKSYLYLIWNEVKLA